MDWTVVSLYPLLALIPFFSPYVLFVLVFFLYKVCKNVSGKSVRFVVLCPCVSV